MMRSLFSAISGLKNHQTYMDVVGNNIANVNTTGFKQSRVTFQDILSQTVRNASGPQNGRGGVNPEQVGLGVAIGGIDTVQTQGTLQSTGKNTDMAIQGDGYFVMNDGKQNLFTRDGAFDVGIDNKLVNPSTGLHVMGWQADPVTGKVDTTQPPTAITIPMGAGVTGKVSTGITLTGNVDASTAAATGTPTSANQVSVPVTVFDSLGASHQLTFTFTKHAPAGTPPTTGWDVAASTTDPTLQLTSGPTPAAISFDSAGRPTGTTNLSIGMTVTSGATVGAVPAGAAAGGQPVVTVDLSGMTQLQSTSDLAGNTDGSSAGSLTSFAVGPSGDITGLYSNGYKQPLGQIALATFSNPSGLTKTSANMFSASPNSGTASIGTPDTSGRGTISTGFLEGSNVDLAQQFSNMIMAERGFQANSRVITTSDEILQDLVNIKH